MTQLAADLTVLVAINATFLALALYLHHRR